MVGRIEDAEITFRLYLCRKGKSTTIGEGEGEGEVERR